MADSSSLRRHRDFQRLWGGQTVSLLGTEVTQLALPLAAILTLHASPFEVAVLTAVEVVPLILFGLPAGVWVDRLRRRPLLIVSDLGRVEDTYKEPRSFARLDRAVIGVEPERPRPFDGGARQQL